MAPAQLTPAMRQRHGWSAGRCKSFSGATGGIDGGGVNMSWLAVIHGPPPQSYRPVGQQRRHAGWLFAMHRWVGSPGCLPWLSTIDGRYPGVRFLFEFCGY